MVWKEGRAGWRKGRENTLGEVRGGGGEGRGEGRGEREKKERMTDRQSDGNTEIVCETERMDKAREETKSEDL
mgnify:CR=1 FL=1